MYVFGLDVPLVEIFFFMTVIMLIMVVMLFYLIVSIKEINKKIKRVMAEEKDEIKGLNALRRDMARIERETEKDMVFLSKIKEELDAVLRNERKELRELKALRGLKDELEGRIKERQKIHSAQSKRISLLKYYT